MATLGASVSLPVKGDNIDPTWLFWAWHELTYIKSMDGYYVVIIIEVGIKRGHKSITLHTRDVQCYIQSM